MSQTVSILIADDHQMVRAALRALLQSQPGMAVVGEAPDGRTAVKMAAELAPGIVVMDLNMPDLNGVDATRQISALGNGTKVIALSGYSDGRFVREMLKAGAMAYVVKEAAFEELAAAARSVAADIMYLSPPVKAILASDLAARAALGGVSPGQTLTPREREVLQLIAEGKGAKDIATRLLVSVKTVETHRRNIMEKLDLYSVADLTKFAIREGLTSLDR